MGKIYVKSRNFLCYRANNNVFDDGIFLFNILCDTETMSAIFLIHTIILCVRVFKCKWHIKSLGNECTLRVERYNAIKSIKNCMLICFFFLSFMFVISKEDSACFSTGNEILFINLFYLCNLLLCVYRQLYNSVYYSLRCNHSCHIFSATISNVCTIFFIQ